MKRESGHFLPDNVVDILWGDYSIECVEENGRWFVSREELTGTSFLKFQGSAIG